MMRGLIGARIASSASLVSSIRADMAVRAPIALLLLMASSLFAATNSPFVFRGYYMTFMRMPVVGLPEWKQMIDCIQEDGGNTLLLWMGGGFRSKHFPITWKYNADHQNVQRDFARDLIDYAHAKGIKVMLGFTPFGYDGVNQYAIEHPHLKAKKADGKPVDAFGIHCWGWSLCPSQPESEEFMLRYVREMAFDFYPSADGLLIESSDYNVCRCLDCKDSYYAREFQFVKQISDEFWARKTNATVIVYPHYFTGKQVNKGTDIEAQAAKFAFDPRWTLFFTPHSAHIDPDLLKQARNSIYSDDAPSLRTPWAIRNGARTALKHGLNGYVPSFEPMSHISSRVEFGAVHMVGKRVKPLGFDWMAEDANPFQELPARVQRFGYREFTRNPELTDDEFRRRMAEAFDVKSGAVGDLLFLQECVNYERNWVSASPVVQPKAAREPNKYQERVERIREIARRYEDPTGETEKEMRRIARFIAERWK